MEIAINNKMEEEDFHLGKKIVNKIFRVTAINVTIVTSVCLIVYLLINYLNTKNDASLMIVIFATIVCAGLIGMLIYSLKVRPILVNSLAEGVNQEECYVFTKDDIYINRNKKISSKYQTEHVLGQYWKDDYYILYLDNKKKKSLLLIKITPSNVDQINFLVKYYHPKRKLIKI